MIEYRTGSLFNAPDEAVIAHACNAQGAWGSGIAKQLKAAYPEAYYRYYDHCMLSNKKLSGTCGLIENRGRTIACLFTSHSYGKFVDPPKVVLRNTERALVELFRQVPLHTEIHMPRINSGLFHVPWEQTEAVLLNVLNHTQPDRKVIVWTPQ
jgi:ADP-ribose 1''-phosphate phosphatase